MSPFLICIGALSGFAIGAGVFQRELKPATRAMFVVFGALTLALLVVSTRGL